MTITETREKSTEKLVKKLDSQLQNYITSNDSKIYDMNKKRSLVDKLLLNYDGILGSPPAGINWQKDLATEQDWVNNIMAPWQGFS